MTNNQFSKIDTQDAYGTQLRRYTSADLKLIVDLYHGAKGSYWWVKLKSVYGPGGDGALNIPNDKLITLAAIINDIEDEFGNSQER